MEFNFGSFVATCTPLVYYMMGIIAYSIFVFRFYKWLAKKDALGLQLHEKHSHESFVSIITKYLLFALENLILIPIFVLLWSVILTAFLAILSHGLTINQIMFTSVALVACTRIAAYYSENLAEDLGKMIPFTLLAIFLFDSRFLAALDTSISMIEELPDMWMTGLYYLLNFCGF